MADKKCRTHKKMYFVFSFNVSLSIMAFLKRALPKAGAWPGGLGMSAPGIQEPALCRTAARSWEAIPGTQGTHRSVQAVGCQHPACHPGSELVLAPWEAPSPNSSIPRGFTRLQGSSGGE